MIELDIGLIGAKVVAALAQVAKRAGYQRMITVDNVRHQEVKRRRQAHLSSSAA